MSISPRPNYNQRLQAMFKKHPRNLAKEEIHKFNSYQNYENQIGEPLESEKIYLPIGWNKNLHKLWGIDLTARDTPFSFSPLSFISQEVIVSQHIIMNSVLVKNECLFT